MMTVDDRLTAIPHYRCRKCKNWKLRQPVRCPELADRALAFCENADRQIIDELQALVRHYYCRNYEEEK